MGKLYMIRHGKTDWNLKGLTQGSVDIPLNEDGRNEARKVASEIDLSDIDICIASPLQRASETAQIITQGKLEIIYDDLLKERSFGDYEGKQISWDVITRHWDYNINDESDNIESIRSCLDRAKLMLEKIESEYSDKNVLIVSHACLIKCIHFNIVGYNEETDFLSFNPQNATLYEYDMENIHKRILYKEM